MTFDQIAAILQGIAPSLITSSIITAAILFIAKLTMSEKIKKMIGKSYEDNLESHKAQLKETSDTAIAKLNSQLTQINVEHQIRFSSLHAKRAEIISQMYELLVRAHLAAHRYTSPIQDANGPHPLTLYADAVSAIQAFFEYFDRNQLWLPLSICAKINPLVDTMRSKVVLFGAFRHIDDNEMIQPIRSQKLEAWDAAWKYFNDEMPAARTALETEFRTLLAGSP